MTFDFNTHFEYHINNLNKAVRDNTPIVQKFYKSPSSITPKEMVEIFDRLQAMEADITLLSNAYDVHLATEKNKRRFTLFKK